jgi:drug/metabolite transporter (DMT)-like permease
MKARQLKSDLSYPCADRTRAAVRRRTDCGAVLTIAAVNTTSPDIQAADTAAAVTAAVTPEVISVPTPAPARSAPLTAGLLLAGSGSVLFSGKAIVIKLAYRYGVDPETLIALRMLFSLPFFAVALWWTSRAAPRLSMADHVRLIVIGLLGYYAASYFDFLGLQYITAGLERLILYLNPTVVLLLSTVFLARRIERLDALALALSYGGIVLVFWHDLRFEGDDAGTGAALVFAATLCYAIYLVVSGEIVARIGAIRLAAYAMCVSTVAVMIQFMLMRPVEALAQPAPVLWLSVVNAGVCTVLPVFMSMMAVARIGAGNVAMMGMVGPISTIAMGFFLLDEAVSVWQLGGTVLVLAGVYVLSQKGRLK